MAANSLSLSCDLYIMHMSCLIIDIGDIHTVDKILSFVCKAREHDGQVGHLPYQVSDR